MPKLDIRQQLSPESLAAIEQSRALYAAFTPTATDQFAKMREGYNNERRYWNAFPVELPVVENLTLDTGEGSVALRLYKPSTHEALPVIIYLHGGGFILGNLDTHDRVQRLLAQKSGWAVLAVDYSLAPERKFPCQLNQVAAVLQQVANKGAAWGLDGSRIALAGDLAGAHLSLCTAISQRDARGPTITGLLLYYGAFGLKDSRSSRLYGWADLDGLDEAEVAFYRSCYLRGPEDRNDPRYDLLRNPMDGLPASFIAAAAFDPLLDDFLVLAEMMAAAAVPHRQVTYPGVLHSFLHYSAIMPLAHQALADGADFLKGL